MPAGPPPLAPLLLVSAPRDGAPPASFWRFEGAPPPGRGDTPVLALAGLGLDGRVFGRLGSLARRRDLVLANLPNRLPPASPSMEDLAREALSILDAAGHAGRPAVLLGSSVGGMVALAAALSFPQRVRALVLVGTCATRADLPWRLRALSRLHPLVPRRAYPRALAAILLPRSRYRDDPEGREELRLQMLRRTKGFVGGFLHAMDGYDVRARLREVAAPALVLHGERDGVIPLAAGRALAAALPRARFTAFPGVAHLPHFSAPGPFGDAVERFLVGERL